jgi:hypothetical protein
MHLVAQFQAVADKRRHRAASLLLDERHLAGQWSFPNAGPGQRDSRLRRDVYIVG